MLTAYPGPVSEADEDVNLRLLRARNATDRFYSGPWDVSRLASVALMSRSHFIREFQRVFGETPHRYLQRRRIERAMFLLRHGTASVTDVCMEVGFTSLGTFSRLFHEIVGLSPSEYRARTAQEDPLIAPTSFAMHWSRPTRERR